MKSTKMYLELSQDIQQFLAENNYDLGELLVSEGICERVSYEVAPFYTTSTTRTMDLTMVLQVVGISTFFIGINTILRTLMSGQVVKYASHIVAVDPRTGEPLMQDGKYIMVEQKVITPNLPPETNSMNEILKLVISLAKKEGNP